MMNKVFVILLVLTIAGAGLLFWLLKTMPQSVVPDPHAEKKDSLVIAKPEGVEVKEGDHGEAAPPTKASHDQPQLKIETEPVKAVVFVDGEMKGQTPLELPLLSKTQQVKLEAHGFKEVLREAPAVTKGADLDTLTWKIVLRAQPGSLKTSPRAEMNETAPAGKGGKGKGTKIAAKEAPTETPKVERSEAKPEKLAAKDAPAAAKAPEAAKVAKTEPAKPTETDEADSDVAEPAVVNPPGVLFLSGTSGPAWVQIQALPGNSRANAEENIRGYRQALNLNVMGCTVEVKGKGRWIRILSGPFDSKTEAQNMLKTINARLRDPAFVTGVQECL